MNEAHMENELITLNFTNRPPLRIKREKIKEIFDSDKDFGHDRIYGCKGEKKWAVWTSKNSGMFFNGRSPKTTRSMLIVETPDKVLDWGLKLQGVGWNEWDGNPDNLSLDEVAAIRSWLEIEEDSI